MVLKSDEVPTPPATIIEESRAFVPVFRRCGKLGHPEQFSRKRFQSSVRIFYVNLIVRLGKEVGSVTQWSRPGWIRKSSWTPTDIDSGNL